MLRCEFMRALREGRWAPLLLCVVALFGLLMLPVQDEEAFKQSQLDALAQAQAAKVEVDALIAKADEVMAKADEVLNTPAVEVAPVVETAPAVEAAPAETKPKKKRRYYKPKAKK